jgi:hypothetical protein
MDLEFDDSSDDLPTKSSMHDLADFLRNTGPMNNGPVGKTAEAKGIDRKSGLHKPPQAKVLPPTAIPPRSHAPVVRKSSDTRKRYDESYELDPQVLQNTQYNARLNLDFIKPESKAKSSESKVKFANYVEQVEFEYVSDTEASSQVSTSMPEYENRPVSNITFSPSIHMATQTESLPDDLAKTMDEQKQKFDKLSNAAYKKIRELLTDRQIMELEIRTLRAQVYCF